MDDFAKLSRRDRADLFRTVATKRNLNPSIIEKDFWVCWTLKRVFSLPKPPAGLLFKGGTSLSKVFKLIERFSEDIDLSFDRAALGFSGENDPLVASSAKKRQKGVEALAEACQKIIFEQFLPQLGNAMDESLGKSSSEKWRLELDPNDPDKQTLLFHYPQGIENRRGDEPAYIRPHVRLELGARSDPWPSAKGTVIPFVAEDFPSAFSAPTAEVNALAAERTFLEKATILHKWYHAPKDKPFRDRLSRHYYDVVRLIENGVGKRALADTELLTKVTQHMDVFFAAGWARYSEAKQGTLHLVPHPDRADAIRRDYEQMREMIFGDQPDFGHLVNVLKSTETAFNGKAFD